MKDIKIKKKKINTDYVKNKEFYDELVDYQNQCKECRNKNLPIPIVPDSIAEKIILIANKLTFRPNFSSYSYKDEMVADSIENCLRYGIQKFNPKFKKPFSYFNKMIWQSFVRRIAAEKKEILAKASLIEEAIHEGVDVTKYMTQEYIDYLQDVSESNREYEIKAKLKRKKKIQNSVEGILANE